MTLYDAPPNLLEVGALKDTWPSLISSFAEFSLTHTTDLLVFPIRLQD